MIWNTFILLAAFLALAYAGLCTFAYFFADSMIFPAPPASYEENASIFKLRTSAGDEVSALHLSAGEASPLLLYSHGNAEDIGRSEQRIKAFQKRGISVLIYEYPGYGTSSGQPSEDGCYAAIQAAYDHALNVLNYRPEQIVLYGRSLGSGPSCWLAERQPVAGLILEGAFTSTFRVMTRVKLVHMDQFDNLARIPEIEAPFLFIHGEQDQVVPFHHALKNVSAVRNQAPEHFWIPDAGHSGLIQIAGEQYWNQVINFITKHSQHEP